MGREHLLYDLSVSGLSLVDSLSRSLDQETDRATLLQSLSDQRRMLADSIVLTPVDSLPFSLTDREHTAFLHGLYLTDKERAQDEERDALILFGCREQAIRDLNSIHRLLANSLGASQGSLRLLSGLHAHTATFMSISRMGETVMLLPEDAGGHFSTRAILERLGLRVIDMPIDYDLRCVDHASTQALIKEDRPDLIFVDRSEGLRYEDFSFIGQIDGPRKVFDASHYLPQLLTDRYPNPLDWGFDLMLFSLHKSMPGPQKAGIVSRNEGGLWEELSAGLSSFVSSSHAEDSYLIGLTLLREDWLHIYAERLLETAHELEDQLLRRGLDVVPKSEQGHSEWPATHHIWMRAPDKDTAFSRFQKLSSAHLHTNYRKLPYGLGYGLRLGTTFSAVSGLSVNHAEELADIVSVVIKDGETSRSRERVRDLAADAREHAIVPPAYWA